MSQAYNYNDFMQNGSTGAFQVCLNTCSTVDYSVYNRCLCTFTANEDICGKNHGRAFVTVAATTIGVAERASM